MPLTGKTIGFIGAGAMAEAIISGILKRGFAKPDNVWASDTDEARLKLFFDKWGLNTTTNNVELVKKADVVILSVKPFVLKSLLEEISTTVSTAHLLISIAAGISTGYISSFFHDRVPVIRVMPNTPALLGEGASALAAGEDASPEHMEFAQKLFASVGRAVVVQEQDMDAVTGLSGSGPAYVYLIIEALADAGVKAGLSRQCALDLAAQTMYGAAKMVLETGEHPAVLKDKVTTPGGTTITGLHIMEKGNLRATVIDAVLAAVERSKEMGAAK